MSERLDFVKRVLRVFFQQPSQVLILLSHIFHQVIWSRIIHINEKPLSNEPIPLLISHFLLILDVVVNQSSLILDWRDFGTLAHPLSFQIDVASDVLFLSPILDSHIFLLIKSSFLCFLSDSVFFFKLLDNLQLFLSCYCSKSSLNLGSLLHSFLLFLPVVQWKLNLSRNAIGRCQSLDSGPWNFNRYLSDFSEFDSWPDLKRHFNLLWHREEVNREIGSQGHIKRIVEFVVFRIRLSDFLPIDN